MRAFLLIGCAALALGACNKADDATDTDMNVAVDNMMVDDNAMMNGGADANMMTDSNTENMMAEDMNTNDPDTNLANGM